jgi:hypothetical protein
MKSRHLFKILQSNFFFFADFGRLLLFGLWDEVEVDNLLLDVPVSDEGSLPYSSRILSLKFISY